MIQSLSALALNGFREARRNRVSVVVVAFTLGILLASQLVTEVTIYTMQRVLTDFGLGLMSLTLVLLAVFLSSGQLAKEIERRTIFMIVSKPVSRTQFVFGRFIGTMLTLGVLVAVMGLLVIAQIMFLGAEVSPAVGVAIGMLFFELMLVVSVGFAMATFSSQLVSAVVTIGAYFVGHLSRDIYQRAESSDSRVLELLGKGVYYLVPNLDRLNYRPLAAYGLDPHWGQVLGSIGYALGYSIALLTIAVIVFERRDFK